jgi:PST family polysaccharide transporter
MTDYLSDYLIAIGKPRTLLGLQALWVAALVPALTLGAKIQGIVGVGVGHMIVAGLVAGPAFLLCVHRTGVRLKQLLRMLWRPFIGGLLGLVTAGASVWYLNGDLTRMAVGSFAAVALFTAMVYPGRAVFGTGGWELAEEPATEAVS